jgi:hypothetical protein
MLNSQFKNRFFPSVCVSGSETLVGSESGIEINVLDPDSDSKLGRIRIRNKFVKKSLYDQARIG